MIVAIMRGGNLCGAMWQRPQLVRKRCSPWMRNSSALTVSGLRVSGREAAAGLAAFALLGCGKANNPAESKAAKTDTADILVRFIIYNSPAAWRNGKQCR